MQLVLAALFFLAFATAANATEPRLGYGSRAGMEVTVLSTAGLDTDRAAIRTRHTREDAMRYCVEYVGRVTQQCIDGELAKPLNDRVVANCRTGEFVDFYGNHYRFEGKAPPNDFSRLYNIRNLSTGEIENGTQASGYWVNIEIFRALCPSYAPDQ